MLGGIQPLAAFHDEGLDARDDGQPVGSCPYAMGSDERQEWLVGWHERDRLDEDVAGTIERCAPREG
jgi:ribosome modulation factor